MKLAPPQPRRAGGRAGARRAAQATARKAKQGSPPGSRRTIGSLEQQADVAADAAVRGRTNVSRGLTPAAPARYGAPSSVGRELPDQARQELETRFGAELAAVRVHDDAAAHSAAHTEEAEAFTAGRHIYFAQGKLDPASVDGRRLLAHEIAHVLQQTGRRMSTTMIHATAREGTGEIQRADAEAPAFAAVARRYGLELCGLRPLPFADDDAADEEAHG